MTAFAEAAREWSAEHPRSVEAITPLIPSGVAVFSSTFHEIVARAMDIPVLRRPGDIDLLVPRQHFGRVSRHLGAAAVVTDVSFRTGDGHEAHVRAREALAYVGNDEIQFLDPQGIMRVGASRYNTAFTLDAAAANTIIETNEGLLPFAHPVETISMYAILQREGDKNDAQNTALLMAATSSLADPHAAERARSIGWDERVWRFIGDAGTMAMDMSVAHPTLAAVPVVI
jgi:hypothetical protein